MVGAAVSIAGAILWGVLHRTGQSDRGCRLFQSQGRFFGGCCGPAGGIESSRIVPGFNRRGDSLGGAARFDCEDPGGVLPVSIAGAILWGVLHDGNGRLQTGESVSIAGAILWGVLPVP